MKKILKIASLLLISLSNLIFAEVKVKQIDENLVEVTFFYGNPKSTDVRLAGNFNDWNQEVDVMEKTEKGYTITKTFSTSDEILYKFVSEGNWTPDMKAPAFIDDGFGGKNGQIILSDYVKGKSEDNSSLPGGKISFQTWTMTGVQAAFRTSSENDPSKKGLDLDAVTFGLKSYNKFVGSFLPSCPIYVEIALAETELDEEVTVDSSPIYLMRKDKDGNDLVEFEDGFQNLLDGLYTNVIATTAQSTDNSGGEAGYGSGSSSKLGHLKFGFDTPYINFTAGFNYAKADVRQEIIWQTVGSGWDAGYQHVGGFNQFSLGDRIALFLEQKTGFNFSLGFAPNKTADRKGTKYGHWGWIGAKKGDFALDFQTNGFYDGNHPFQYSVEQDFILGVKNSFYIGGNKLNLAAQGLLALHQKSFDNTESSDLTSSADYFGYSTDVFYRSGSFDGIKNFASQIKVAYQARNFDIEASYRFRGFEASQLYVRENIDDGTFDISEQLGVLNSQNIDVKGNVKFEKLGLSLAVKSTIPLEDLTDDDEFNAENYWGAAGGIQTWYEPRCASYMLPLFTQNGGTELTFSPAVTYSFDSIGLSLSAYSDLKASLYTFAEGDWAEQNEYDASDSQFLFEKAGITAEWNVNQQFVKKVNVFYGFDNSNSVRLFNTLVGQVDLLNEIEVTAGICVKTVKYTDAAAAYDSDWNNPFAFVLGASKRLSSLNRPYVYAQVVYNTDMFKRFGEGQEQLSLNRANINSRWDKGGSGDVSAVDYFDGKAAIRTGIRWEI
ncbi:MAG: glycogen-binding domain-containing protein [Treponema sp.]|nr:glycogen-binding domain-containing protein [Treponema sp.]